MLLYRSPVLVSTLLFATAAAAGPELAAQAKGTFASEAVPGLVRDAVRAQLDDFHHSTWALQYRVHRNDGKEDTERELIESTAGNVARTMIRNGQPLTAEEDAAERERLKAVNADDLARRKNRSQGSDRYGTELIRALPEAMLYTLASGQPQLQDLKSEQVVLDFTPNPQYHPSTAAQSALQSLAGRAWIDAETHHLLRLDLKLIHNVNYMGGMLVRVYEGGTMSYEQRLVGGGHYAYTHLRIDVKIRELMLRNVPYSATYTVTNARYLARVPSVPEAIQTLLAIPSATR